MGDPFRIGRNDETVGCHRGGGACMKKRAVIAVAIGVCVALGAWAFDALFERVTRKAWVGYRGEAAKQPFLAAERSLEGQGMEPERVGTLAALEAMPPQSAMLVGPGRRALSTDQIDDLLAWASAGNHLIVAPEVASIGDELLDRLEVRRDGGTQKTARRKQPADADKQSSSTPDEAAQGCGGMERIAEIALPGIPRTYQADIGRSPSLMFDPHRMDFIWSGEQGIQITSLPWDAGRVTIMPIRMFTNDRIGQFDHAALLHAVVGWQTDTLTVGFFDHKDRRSLVDWILEHAFWVVVAAAVMTLLVLWRAMVRFGPIAPDPATERRSLIDHLTAAGRFRWRTGDRNALVGAARAFAMDQTARSIPGFAQMSADEQRERLCTVVGLPTGQIQHALTSTATKPAELIHVVSILRRIHAATGARALRTKKGNP
jgi:Domain of unknown function (DUF4350)